MIRVRRYFAEEAGLNAAEFALVLPFLFTFIFGVIHLCLMMYTHSRLHWATEDAARCASVRSDCKTSGVTVSTKVTAWAASRYSGMAAATFVYSAAGSCNQIGGVASGKQVTGTATYQIKAILVQLSFPLSATACFP